MLATEVEVVALTATSRGIELTATLDQTAAEDLLAFCKEMPKRAGMVMRKARNRTATKVVRVAASAISKNLGIKRRDLLTPHRFGAKKGESTGIAIRPIEAKNTTDPAHVFLSGKPIPLGFFGARERPGKMLVTRRRKVNAERRTDVRSRVKEGEREEQSLLRSKFAAERRGLKQASRKLQRLRRASLKRTAKEVDKLSSRRVWVRTTGVSYRIGKEGRKVFREAFMGRTKTKGKMEEAFRGTGGTRVFVRSPAAASASGIIVIEGQGKRKRKNRLPLATPNGPSVPEAALKDTDLDRALRVDMSQQFSDDIRNELRKERDRMLKRERRQVAQRFAQSLFGGRRNA